MTKKEELLRMYCDRMTDIECYVFYGKDGVLKAMEEYGKYCAKKAWIGFARNTALPISSISFEDWWNEFKEKEQ